MPRRQSREQKLTRKAKKAAKKDQRATMRRRESALSVALQAALAEAEQLRDEGALDEAAVVLEEIARRFPRRLDVLGALADAYRDMGDAWSYQATCAKIVDVDPADADTLLALAGVAMTNGQFATALRAFGQFLSRWPDHPEAVKAGELLDLLEAAAAAEASKHGMPEDRRTELLLMHDDINLHIQLGDYERVCEVAAKLLEESPHFAPAWNNRCQAHFQLGRLDQALADAQKVLDFDADNFHARANLTRYLLIGGQAEEALASAELLKTLDSESGDLFVKQAEALSCVGDWAGVLDALERAQARGYGEDSALLHHLAGVAAARLDQIDAARKHWKRAVKLDPILDVAQENLADLKLPLGKQSGPWAYRLESWIPRAIFLQLSSDLERTSATTKDGDVARRVRKFLPRYPWIERLLPVLLDRGDPAAMVFAVRASAIAQLTAMWPALQLFATGRRGSDEVRHQAALVLLEADVISPGQQRMWVQGEFRELMLMSYEISPEPAVELPPQVNRLALQARQALNAGDGAEAERLLTEAMRLRSDDVSLRFNYSIAIEMQGRVDEAQEIVRGIHARHPDYLFARVRLAEQAVDRGEIENARELLNPLMSRKRFHLSEYAALCSAHIDMLVADGKLDGAKSWLRLWEQANPDDPRLEAWRDQLESRGRLAMLAKVVDRGKSRLRTLLKD